MANKEKEIVRELKMSEDLDPDLRDALMKARNGILIALVKRAGGKLTMSIAELDAAVGLLTFNFTAHDVTLELKHLDQNSKDSH